MKIEIRHRWNGAVLYTSEQPDTLTRQRALGMAVLEALEKKADLRAANLSDANLSAANLSAANLSDADLSAANLSAANLRAADLSAANLSAANLSAANLSAANLRAADLRAADISAANLRAADLSDADLSAANLSAANLSDANLSDANSTIHVPIVEKLHSKILAAIDGGGTLDMGSWHTCETTHCRAGWAIHLAGEAGKVLESCLGPEAAGALISIKSCPHLEGKVPNFFATAEEALADIRRLAELETA